MAKQRNAVRAGIFMLVSLALILFVIVAISGAGKFTEAFKTYPVAFSLQDDIGGLRIGDDVRIGGLKVGSVRDIEIEQSKSAVVVFIDVPAKYAIARDADIQVQRGLTGGAAINIDDLGVGPPPGSNQYLRGHPDETTGLMHELGAMEPDLRQTVANLKIASGKLNTDLDKFGNTSDSATSTVRDLHADIPEILAHYKKVTEEAVSMLDTWRDFLGPSSTDFHQTVANLNQVTGEVRHQLPDILDRVHEILANADVAVTRAGRALKDIQTAAANLSAASGSLRSILVDNHSKLNGMIESLNQTIDNLKYASVEIRHSPWRLLYQPKPGEMDNLNIYDSVREFAEGASSLDDAAAALRDTLKDPKADPAQVKRLMQHLDDSFTRFQTVQQKLWTDIKE